MFLSAGRSDDLLLPRSSTAEVSDDPLSSRSSTAEVSDDPLSSRSSIADVSEDSLSSRSSIAERSEASLRPRSSVAERAVSILPALSSASRRRAPLFMVRLPVHISLVIYLSQMLLPPPCWSTVISSPSSKPLNPRLFAPLACSSIVLCCSSTTRMAGFIYSFFITPYFITTFLPPLIYKPFVVGLASSFLPSSVYHASAPLTVNPSP